MTLAFAFGLTVSVAASTLTVAQQPPPVSAQTPASSQQSSSSSRAPQPPAAASNGISSKVTLETSETLFALLAAINSCGDDQELAVSDPLRGQIRNEVAESVAASAKAGAARDQLCSFYKDHQPPQAARDLAQYVSLALYLGEPPKFTPALQESDLPPDAEYVFGIVTLLQNFYAEAGLHQIWQKHQPDYDALVSRLHEPVADMILRTDLYLKLQLSSYLGRRFAIFLEPLAAPGEVNARNYGEDYFMVLSPAAAGKLRLDEVRHTYLHYVLDPYAGKYGSTLKRLEPLLQSVRAAPMDESFKDDIALLVTESLIRAIEARTINAGSTSARPAKSHATGERDKAAEAARRETDKVAEAAARETVKADESEGFILTGYFYDALVKFEKDPAGLKDSYSDWIHDIDLAREKKLASQVNFSQRAAPELLQASKTKQAQSLDLAEKRLAEHDPAGAQKLARQALEEHNEDPARALFILARAAAQSGDMSGARSYFERTLEVAREPRMLAWSHIYLGRIYDLQENRDAALTQYRAALTAGNPDADTRVAAERGLAQAYEPPEKR